MGKPCISIPIVDLSPFFHEGDEDGKKKAIEMIRHACAETGFFKIVNHGVPVDLMSRALQVSTTFFQYPVEEKLKSKPMAGTEAPFPAGYRCQPESSTDKNEYLLMLVPTDGSDASRFNVYPNDPPEFRSVLEETSCHLTKAAALVESILNECMGLPHNFFHDYNNERSSDFMVAFHFFPATTNEDNSAIKQHNDSNFLALVFEDEVGGLEVLKEGQWIPVTPTEGAIVVNIGDAFQVLSNKKFRSSTHRELRSVGKSRYSYAFFYNLDGKKWVEPLPQFTKEIGEAPKCRGFVFGEYMKLIVRDRTHPPSKPEDVVNISYYDIPT